MLYKWFASCFTNDLRFALQMICVLLYKWFAFCFIDDLCFESKKAIYDIGTEIQFKKLDSHKHIKNWEIENVKTWFWKLSTGIRPENNQNVLSSHLWLSKNVLIGFAGCLFLEISPRRANQTMKLMICFQKIPPEGQLNHAFLGLLFTMLRVTIESKKAIYDIGTEILNFHCFLHNGNVFVFKINNSGWKFGQNFTAHLSR